MLFTKLIEKFKKRPQISKVSMEKDVLQDREVRKARMVKQVRLDEKNKP